MDYLTQGKNDLAQITISYLGHFMRRPSSLKKAVVGKAEGKRSSMMVGLRYSGHGCTLGRPKRPS